MLEKGSVAAASLCQVYKCRLKEWKTSVKGNDQTFENRWKRTRIYYVWRRLIWKSSTCGGESGGCGGRVRVEIVRGDGFRKRGGKRKNLTVCMAQKGRKMDDVVNGAAGNSDNNGRKSKLEIRVPKVYEEHVEESVGFRMIGTPLTSGSALSRPKIYRW